MFKEERSTLQFQWAHLGDIALGRPHLGPTTSVAVYRLMQFTLRDVMIKHFGPEKAGELMREAGHAAGQAFYENLLLPIRDLEDLAAKTQRLLKDLHVGILRMESADETNQTFTMTVAEDLDCSGLPLMNEMVCTYDEGFLAGILEAFYGKPFEVKEVDCWCSGERICRFKARALSQ